MSGLWRKNQATPEGKYPVVLRRDGSLPEWPYFVLGGRDFAAPEALDTYAKQCELIGCEAVYVADVRMEAVRWRKAQIAHGDDMVRSRAEAAKYPHRKDDPLTLQLARREITMAEIAARLCATPVAEDVRGLLARLWAAERVCEIAARTNPEDNLGVEGKEAVAAWKAVRNAGLYP